MADVLVVPLTDLTGAKLVQGVGTRLGGIVLKVGSTELNISNLTTLQCLNVVRDYAEI